MNRLFHPFLTLRVPCVVVAVLGLASLLQADGHPRPSPYPIAWELDFRHETPRRIVLEVREGESPQAFWYLPYMVTNNTDRERMFLPVFEMLTDDGRVIRSDRNIPPIVFRAIRQRERRQFLEAPLEVYGELRIGDDQARESVAIWPEPPGGMREFTIFITGLSGEAMRVPGPDDEDVILRKSRQLDYRLRGAVVRPGARDVIEVDQRWIMR
jgi:hypothetical protein